MVYMHSRECCQVPKVRTREQLSMREPREALCLCCACDDTDCEEPGKRQPVCLSAGAGTVRGCEP